MALYKGHFHFMKTLLQHSNKERVFQVLALNMIYISLVADASYAPTHAPTFGKFPVKD